MGWGRPLTALCGGNKKKRRAAENQRTFAHSETIAAVPTSASVTRMAPVPRGPRSSSMPPPPPPPPAAAPHVPSSSSGGITKKGIFPAFQSMSTARAAFWRSGTPPRPTMPRLLAMATRNSAVEEKAGIPNSAMSFCGAQRARMPSTAASGSSTCSTEMQLRRSRPAPPSSPLLPSSKMMPGQSSSVTFASSDTSCMQRVKPGVALTPTALLRFSELMMLLLPTFG